MPYGFKTWAGSGRELGSERSTRLSRANDGRCKARRGDELAPKRQGKAEIEATLRFVVKVDEEMRGGD